MPLDRDPLNRPFFLPRLPTRAYQGEAVVHWTLTIEDRGTGWLTPALHARFRELLLHTLIRGRLLCPAYVLMPDHLHLLLMGTDETSDQRISIAFLRTHLEPELRPFTFQHQPHDHVLRKEETKHQAFETTAGYVIQNPVRSGLVTEARDWSYGGCLLPGYPRLHLFQDDYWEKFWRIYFKLTWPHGEKK